MYKIKNGIKMINSQSTSQTWIGFLNFLTSGSSEFQIFAGLVSERVLHPVKVKPWHAEINTTNLLS